MTVAGALLLTASATAAGAGSGRFQSTELLAVVGRTVAYETETVYGPQGEDELAGIHTFEVYGRPSGAPLVPVDESKPGHHQLRFYTCAGYDSKAAPSDERYRDPNSLCPSPLGGNQLYLVFLKRGEVKSSDPSERPYLAVACTKIDPAAYGFARDY